MPLVPHQQSLTVGPTTYTLRAYVTYPNSDLSSPDLRVTVVVSWTSVERRSLQNFVQAQSLFASPGGCLSTRTHPFAAPCQPFLYGTSVRDQGHIDVTGTIDSVSLDHATLWVPGFGSAIQVEQISSVQGTSEANRGWATI